MSDNKLTFTEMISQIEEGEIYENTNFDECVRLVNNNLCYVTKSGYLIEGFGHDGLVIATSHILNSNYVKQKNYITFPEALESLKEGKEVVCEIKDVSWTYKLEGDEIFYRDNDNPESHFRHIIDIDWVEILEGKWYVKE